MPQADCGHCRCRWGRRGDAPAVLRNWMESGVTVTVTIMVGGTTRIGDFPRINEIAFELASTIARTDPDVIVVWRPSSGRSSISFNVPGTTTGPPSSTCTERVLPLIEAYPLMETMP